MFKALKGYGTFMFARYQFSPSCPASKYITSFVCCYVLKSSFCFKSSFFLLLILLGSDHSDINCPVKITWGQTEPETNTENHDYPRSEIEILAYTAHTAYTTSINIMRTVKYLLELEHLLGPQLDAKYLMDILFRKVSFWELHDMDHDVELFMLIPPVIKTNLLWP